jgi:hypothetical protein
VLEAADLLSERMKPALWKWMFWCGLLGLLVPVALILRWKLLGSTFGQLELILWPSSIMLMGLAWPHRSVFDVIQFYAIVVVANMVLYCVIGLLTWPVVRLALRHRRGLT